MAQDLFRVERGFADDNIEYLSGSGVPAGVSGDTLTAPVGSIYSDTVSGNSFKKTGNLGVAGDWERLLDQSDYDYLSNLVGGGVQDVQDELDAVEAAVGLNSDGTYTAPAGSNYLGATTTIKDGLVALDSQINSVATDLSDEIADRVAADAAEVLARDAAIAVETQARVDADAAEVIARDAAIAVETQARIDADAAVVAAQAIVDAAQDLLIGGKVDRAGDTMSGNLAFNGIYTVTGLANPVNAGDAVNKAYLENLINGLTWLPPVSEVVATNPVPGVDGTRVLNTTDGKIYTVVAGSFDAGVAVASGVAVMELATSAGWTFNGTTWVQFTGAGQITAGVGLKKTGNVIDVNLGAGIAQLPTDEVGIDVLSTGGLFLTADGTTSSTDTDAQLAIKLDGSTLVVGPNGLKVSDTFLDGLDTALAAEILARQNADAAEVIARDAAIAVETQARIDADAAEVLARDAAIAVETQARIDADAAEVLARDAAIAAAVAAEVIARDAAIAVETQARIDADAAEVIARDAAIAVETQARIDADAAEVIARDAAIAVETQARIDADAAIDAKIADARTDINTGVTPITASTVVDSVGPEIGAIKWLVRVTGMGSDADKYSAFEVLAMNDSNGASCTMVDYTVYAKLKKGTIAGLSVTVELNGNTMELRVASTNGVKIMAAREVVRVSP